MSGEESARDKLVNRMMADQAHIGLTTTVNRVLQAGLTLGLMKLVITGASSYQMVQWMNVRRRRAGRDTWPVYDEVWEKYREDINALS